jgi:hypothetical protein
MIHRWIVHKAARLSQPGAQHEREGQVEITTDGCLEWKGDALRLIGPASPKRIGLNEAR